MERERVAEIALYELHQIPPVLDENRLVETELTNQEPADLGVGEGVPAREAWLPRGEVNQDEDKRDNSENDGNGRHEAPQQPRHHLSLHAVSVDLPVVGDAPGAEQRRPGIGANLHVVDAVVDARHVTQRVEKNGWGIA